VRGLGWAAVCILSWAPMFSIAKRTLPVVDAFALGTVRYSIGALVFLALLALVEGRGALAYEGRFVRAAIAGVLGITGFNVLVWYGLNFSRPEHASIIMALQTPLIAIAVWTAYGQRPARFTLACVGLAIVGVLLVVTKGDPVQALGEIVQGGALLGDLLIACGALSWVAYTLSAARFAGWSALRFTALTCLPGLGGLVAANMIAVGAGIAVVPSAAALGSVAWQIVYFAVCSVVLGVLGFNAGVKRLGPLNMMLMLNLIPVSVFAIEAALGRRFEPVELAGAALVIGALAANNLYLRRRNPS
jgi:drug/metabolite transporter (DMT)-like permease